MHAYVDTNTVGGYAFLKDLKKKERECNAGRRKKFKLNGRKGRSTRGGRP